MRPPVWLREDYDARQLRALAKASRDAKRRQQLGFHRPDAVGEVGRQRAAGRHLDKFAVSPHRRSGGADRSNQVLGALDRGHQNTHNGRGRSGVGIVALD